MKVFTREMRDNRENRLMKVAKENAKSAEY